MPKLLLLALLLTACSSPKQTAVPQATSVPPANSESCQKFVQEFYDWYIGLSKQDFDQKYPGPTDIHASKLRPQSFASGLANQLKIDSDSNKDGEIGGLDFDPVLNAQDDDWRWVVTRTRINNDHCFADLHLVPEPPDAKGDIVTAELQMANGQWQFLNFHYPASGIIPPNDLLSLLKSLREQRAKNSSK